MAKESMKAREVKRARLVKLYAERKAALKAQAKELAKQGECAYDVYQQLQKPPKHASAIRMHNRCSITGRPKGYIRQFGISRIQFREMASAGLIPGVKKASW
jgi:small subunit ribosomal protein S14